MIVYLRARLCVCVCVCIGSCEYVRCFIWVICKYIFRGTNSIWFIHHSISKHVRKSTCALNANNNKHPHPMCTLHHRHKLKLGKKGEQKSIELHEIICASKIKHLFHVSSYQMNKHPPQNTLNGTTKANKWTVFTEHHIQYSAQFSSTLYSLYLGTISERCSPLLFYRAHQCAHVEETLSKCK